MGYLHFRCQEKTDPGSPGTEMCDSFNTCIANRVASVAVARPGLHFQKMATRSPRHMVEDVSVVEFGVGDYPYDALKYRRARDVVKI
jgi:hypothetical protein